MEGVKMKLLHVVERDRCQSMARHLLVTTG